MNHLKVAIADDEQQVLNQLQYTVNNLGHQPVIMAKTGRELVAQCKLAQPDLIITDIRMPDMDGIDAVRLINQQHPTPAVIISAHHGHEMLNRVTDDNVLAFLVKPVKTPDLEAAITIAINRFHQFQALRQEATELYQALSDRKIIEKAKGIIMKKAKLDESAAYRRMQHMASKRNLKLVEFANHILLAEEVYGE